jgi:hypothetical protein
VHAETHAPRWASPRRTTRGAGAAYVQGVGVDVWVCGAREGRRTLVASCLRGALPPVLLRAVCLVRAMAPLAVYLPWGEEWSGAATTDNRSHSGRPRPPRHRTRPPMSPHLLLQYTPQSSWGHETTQGGGRATHVNGISLDKLSPLRRPSAHGDPHPRLPCTPLTQQCSVRTAPRRHPANSTTALTPDLPLGYTQPGPRGPLGLSRAPHG